MTACNRPSLLEKTFDSFLEMNTYPIEKYIINEDSGIPNVNDHLIKKYSHLNIEWIFNTKPLGQIASIDNMYSKITTEYIFHCEEDWLFSDKSFIEKSLKIMETNPKILLVWLRAQNDTNGMPVEKFSEEYDMLRGRNRKWYGFTFNPALRRLSDYKLIGSYMSVGHEDKISIQYNTLGFRAAILKSKHVEHIGYGYHVKDPIFSRCPES